jgi:hypothetical protein
VFERFGSAEFKGAIKDMKTKEVGTGKAVVLSKTYVENAAAGNTETRERPGFA